MPDRYDIAADEPEVVEEFDHLVEALSETDHETRLRDRLRRNRFDRSQQVQREPIAGHRSNERIEAGNGFNIVSEDIDSRITGLGIEKASQGIHVAVEIGY